GSRMPALAGSPGNTRNMKKFSVTTKIIVVSAQPSRRMIYSLRCMVLQMLHEAYGTSSFQVLVVCSSAARGGATNDQQKEGKYRCEHPEQDNHSLLLNRRNRRHRESIDETEHPLRVDHPALEAIGAIGFDLLAVVWDDVGHVAHEDLLQLVKQLLALGFVGRHFLILIELIVLGVGIAALAGAGRDLLGGWDVKQRRGVDAGCPAPVDHVEVEGRAADRGERV